MHGSDPAPHAVSERSTDTRLSILMIASEAVPFAKTGGLADVASALAVALGRLGHRVTVMLPRYREAASAGVQRGTAAITLGGRTYEVGLFNACLDDRVGVVLLECPELYDREGLYGSGGRDHPDNAQRFGVLARAALEVAGTGNEPPSVIHAHDWQAGLAPVYVRTTFEAHPELAGTATVFTIHNMAYQGRFPSETLSELDLDGDLFTSGAMAHRGQISFLKGGVVFSDAITTVSRQYAREIMTPDFGRGLDEVLVGRAADLTGIVNGIDTDTWNPATDAFLPTPFSASSMSGKQDAKRAVLERYGLAADGAALERPLVGMVTRLVSQKGLDLVAEIADRLPCLDAAFVVLGTGAAQYEELWRGLAMNHPRQIGVRVGFDEALAHLIEGGADMFLMPSQFEPCGLNQMYSLRYGTVPVVRATGGLHDTVEHYDPRTGRGTGFTFTEYSGQALLGALGEALEAFQDRRAWQGLQAAGMREDHSWDVSAREYVKVYRRAIRSAAARAQTRTSGASSPGS